MPVLQKGQAPVNRGTPALIAHALKVDEIMGQSLPFAYLEGNIGLGDGSRRLYAHLCENLSRCRFNAIVFHYLQPDVDWHNRVLFTVREMTNRPILIADAGLMYAAKSLLVKGKPDYVANSKGIRATIDQPVEPEIH